MTLVIGAATKDYVVIVSDGNAQNMDNVLLHRRNFRKIYKLHNSIYFGFAASGFTRNDLLELTDGARRAIDFTPPFTVYEKAIEFGNFARNIFASRPDVGIDFLFGGFDCDADENFIDSQLFSMSSDSDYEPSSKIGRRLHYLPESCPDVLSGYRLSNNDRHIKELLFGGLKFVASEHPLIGGTASGVVISRSNNNWYEYDLESPPSPQA